MQEDLTIKTQRLCNLYTTLQTCISMAWCWGRITEAEVSRKAMGSQFKSGVTQDTEA